MGRMDKESKKLTPLTSAVTDADEEQLQTSFVFF